MGLDTSHDCWHGAYSAFGRWRQAVAEAAGYAVWEVKHDKDSSMSYPTVMIEWHRYRPEIELWGEWAETPHDPLIVLIAHSDCDGVIHPAQAAPLADRLEELLPKIAEYEDRSGGHIEARGGMVKCTEKFIAGLRAAVAAGEDVDFH